MAKSKSPKDIVVEYFQGIKYFQEEDRVIVILPEGLRIHKADLTDKQIDLEMVIEDLGGILFVAELDAPAKTKELLVLQAEDAKQFESR